METVWMRLLGKFLWYAGELVTAYTIFLKAFNPNYVL
jgi:hypothetical protein